MKSHIIDINGNKTKEINLPKCFSARIREDIVAKVLETKKTKQPYSPSPVAGKQHSASGKMRHRRHVWQTHYGKGMSRIPRKVMSRRGTQFNWIGAEISSTKGGRRAHPPKILSMINTKKINKKELRCALISALSATANPKIVAKKYSTLKDQKINGLPFVVDSKLISLKTKEMISSLAKILGENLLSIAVQERSVRSGVGKLRGRRYKKNAGVLLVVGEKEKLKTSLFDVVRVDNLSINELAKGGLGRLTIYTENAIKGLEKIQ